MDVCLTVVCCNMIHSLAPACFSRFSSSLLLFGVLDALLRAVLRDYMMGESGLLAKQRVVLLRPSTEK